MAYEIMNKQLASMDHNLTLSFFKIYGCKVQLWIRCYKIIVNNILIKFSIRLISLKTNTFSLKIDENRKHCLKNYFLYQETCVEC